MHADAPDLEIGLTRVEVLVLNLALRVAVHGVGDVRVEVLHVEVAGAGADLLVRRERDAQRTVRRAVAKHALERAHDLRDASLVVHAQNRGAVARERRAIP